MIHKQNKDIDRTLTQEPAPESASKFEEANIDAFQKRITALIEHFGSASEIARRCDFSEAVVRSWRNGGSDPSRARCIALARGTGASLLWIVAGEGPMWASETATESHSHAVRLDDMTMAIQLVEEALEGKFLPREKRAELFALVYDGLVEGLPEATVLRWARTAAK